MYSLCAFLQLSYIDDDVIFADIKITVGIISVLAMVYPK